MSVLDRTKDAVDWLLMGAAFTHGQRRMLFEQCIIPIFRYSAPLIQWSPAQLDALDMIWLKAQIHIYRLNERILRAPLFPGTVHGGLGSPAAVEYLMKELAIHIEQCTQREDELNSLILHATREEVKVSGFLNLELAFRNTPENLALVDTYSNRSPIWHLQHLVREVGSLSLGTTINEIQHTHPPDSISQVVHEALIRINPTRTTTWVYRSEEERLADEKICNLV